MTTTSTVRTRSSRGTSEADHPVLPADRFRDPAYQAFLILRTAFVVAPVLFGLDKFFNWMTHWPKYLWAGPPHWLGVSPQHFMDGVGVIEILAGLLVLTLPRWAPYVVAAWLAGSWWTGFLLNNSDWPSGMLRFVHASPFSDFARNTSCPT